MECRDRSKERKNAEVDSVLNLSSQLRSSQYSDIGDCSGVNVLTSFSDRQLQ
jgi:hypothetical protein